MKYILLITYFYFSIGVVFGQYSISGKITNNDGEELPYASIYLHYSKIGTTSNEIGDFSLNIPASYNFQELDTLTISYVGYKKEKIPVYFTIKSITINVSMNPSIIRLNEVVIKPEKTYTPEEIVEKVIYSIKSNYCRDQTLMDGVYRELVKEDNKWIELNEAVIKLNYSSYPQKGFIRKSWRKYWDDGFTMNYGVSLGNVFRHSQFFPYYTSPNDEVKIVASRISHNQSKYSMKPTPYGGPLDLVSVDKIKYLYDFLDPKLIKKYRYDLLRTELYNNEWCYVIDFHPNESYLKKIYHQWNKKFETAIYTGRMYITVETFAVINFECQFSTNADFRVYNRNPYKPDFVKLDVSYKKYNNYWILNKVNTEQWNTKELGQKKIQYVCVRTLELSNPRLDNINFKKEEILPLTHSATLRYFDKKYNNKIWKESKDSTYYVPLSSSIKNDLEQTVLLEEQFESHNFPIDSLRPPYPQEIPDTHYYSYDTVQDNYNWLSHKKDSATVNYLKDENSYYTNVLNKIHKYRKSFYYQYLNIFKPDTAEHYVVYNGNNYKWKLEENGIVSLFRILSDTVHQKVFDYSSASQGKINFFIESLQFNRNKKLAYTYCERGNISNTLIVKPENENISLDSISSMKEFIWLNDSTILYTKIDSSERSYQLRARKIGHNKAIDSLIYWEADSNFDLSIKTSISGKYIFLIVESLDENEYYVLNKDDQNLNLQLIVKRRKFHQYTLDHFKGNTFYAITNRTKINNELVEFSTNSVSEEYWKILYRTKNIIEDFTLTKDFYVLKEYINTSLELKYINKKSKKLSELPFSENIYVFDFVKSNKDILSNIIQVEFVSPVTPYTLLNIDLNTEETNLVEKEELNDNFSKEKYETKIVWATSDDGTKIPITLFYNKEAIGNKLNGIILKSYGAYGAKYYSDFNIENIIYANAGFIVAYAHVRGGGELGNAWYIDGKELNKTNTFKDYISCANYLKKKYNISSKQLIGYGLSAGGLIMGYVANNYPDLMGILIFDRPYLDVVNTMTNKNIPLTTLEYKEWGNPKDLETFNYIKSYSPYQNITAQSYPNMMFHLKYHDEQTPYWQVAKSVAKYRNSNHSNSIILLNTDFKSGHRGSVNSEQRIDEMADQFAFILYLINK